ncbi:DUF6345 domain-containing protein [Deinococcus peraridilitoris]|uniref:Gingipain domain-containing protein n=1 Tax=Deinococcus peraridilitoris (strain DSM 19664 / LMG 22246 / CIP 109416 / KR-200) TaxID=937777 RepID=L0A886_DEIPD|nr:DUF6345 domain-containing protein [Deinococcus peraridilitoris]AFZ69619.1 hypothetical protein Deipe_4271 [Deinococcus peraridilitoris DSM 19664]
MKSHLSHNSSWWMLSAMITLSLAGCAKTGSAPSSSTLPVLTVISQGPTLGQAQALQAAFGLPVTPYDETDGAIRFLDTTRFHVLPTTPLPDTTPNEEGTPTTNAAFDFAAINAMPVYPDGQAASRTQAAFSAAGLATTGGKAEVEHATFEAVQDDGTVDVSKAIDTQVGYDFSFNGLPLAGPGAKVKVVFDPAGAVSQVQYAMRGVQSGEQVPVITAQQADARAQQRIGKDVLSAQGSAVSPTVRRDLVYYAPPLALKSVTKYFPHYRYVYTSVVNGQTVNSKVVYVPAVQAAPTPTVSMNVVDHHDIEASVHVAGGTAPYTYRWVSSNMGVVGEGPTVRYFVGSEEDAGTLVDETLSVVVTDANGLSVEAGKTTSITAGYPFLEPKAIRPLEDSSVEVGVWSVGMTYSRVGQDNLPLSVANGNNFAARFQRDAINVAYNKSEASAYEQHLKSGPSELVDRVDLGFFTGHGMPTGVLFSSSRDDSFLDISAGDTVQWGNTDLEWMVFAACEVLQRTAGGRGVANRWGPSFKGLHMMLGYHNISEDTSNEGEKFADYMLRQKILWVFGNDAMKVREAWVQAATDTQSRKVQWAYMGFYGNNNRTNMNDYFHGRGSVSSDINAAERKGTWYVRGPS